MTGNLSPRSTEYSLQTTTAPLHPSLQQSVQPSLTQQCSRTYEALSLSTALASTATVATPFLDITIAMQYMTRHKWRSCNKFGITDIFFCRADNTRWFTYSKHRCHAHIQILLLSTAVLPQHSILHLHTAVAHSSGIAPVGNLYCRSSCL